MNQRPILRVKPKAAAPAKGGHAKSSSAWPGRTAPPTSKPAATPATATAPTTPPGMATTQPTSPPATSSAPASTSARPVTTNNPVLQPGYLPKLRPDSLAFSLFCSAHVLAQVKAGSALPQALTKTWGQFAVQAAHRGAIQDLANRTLRHRGLAQALISAMTSKAPEPPMLHALLSCALALLAQAPEQRGYEEFTVVDQTVSVATAHPDMAHAKGMVNAVLRRFLRERDSLMAQVLQQPEAQWNFPLWWIQAVQTAYPQDWQSVLRSSNSQPPLTLRVNQRQGSVADYLALLQEHDIAARQIGPSAIRLDKPIPVTQIPGFEQGRVSVQDAGAQLAAPLLDVQPGMRVLDACAAPGGKTGHLLELADIDLTALDVDPIRLQRVGENLKRLQLSATLKAFDAQGKVWWDGQPFDRILADVPCTASGIVRRHSDIPWLRRKSDTLQLATLSARILDNLWQMLAPNGKLLLVTCSIWPQESEGQAAAFAARHQARRLDAPGQLLPNNNGEDDFDGLFYALFQKIE
jgi:16S rRNA (cytosine967-C5)-methyltransferase